ncbi:MAG TPA: Stp1/IreP family PP2C-type Ser/Thr phosphatase [Burkholderiales bacterium]|nr:Stp1/IreP family PP2C-type Ser/Thr phosphatase [Burkholderiales bacterium]
MDLSRVLEIASKSDPGRVRSHNEDSIGSDASIGLAVLADGMGGYNAGEVASGIAVSMIASGMKAALSGTDPGKLDAGSGERLGARMLREQVAAANSAIFNAARDRKECEGMGTTLVAALFYEDRVSVAHLGDSRMYRLRGEKLERMTHDHSLLQEQLDSGMLTREEARFSRYKNIVTRALGIEQDVDIEVKSFDVSPEDIYLLCSDGLNDMLDDEEIGLVVDTLRSNLELAAEQLVELANENGGRDNISVILVKVKQGVDVQRGLVSRLMSSFRK